MKYRSINNFQDFEFHDCVFSLISWENDRLTISAKHLNIHETAEQNTFGSDMEIDEAHIIFYGFQLNEFEPSRNWYQDANGNLQTNEPLIIYKGTKARSMLKMNCLIHLSLLALLLPTENMNLVRLVSIRIFQRDLLFPTLRFYGTIILDLHGTKSALLIYKNETQKLY